jgi:hypothetical protein
MLKALLILLLIFDVLVLLLLLICFYTFIKYGCDNILLPGIGLVVSLCGFLFLLFVVEVLLVIISILLFFYIKHSRIGLA